MIVPGVIRNKGKTGYEIIFINTPDISECVEIDFYEYFWYWDSPQGFPREKKQLVTWLVFLHKVDQAMVYYVMSDKGEVISRSTVSPLDLSDYDVNETKFILKDLDHTIRGVIGNFRNSISENNIQTPDMGEDDIIL